MDGQGTASRLALLTTFLLLAPAAGAQDLLTRTFADVAFHARFGPPDPAIGESTGLYDPSSNACLALVDMYGYANPDVHFYYHALRAYATDTATVSTVGLPPQPVPGFDCPTVPSGEHHLSAPRSSAWAGHGAFLSSVLCGSCVANLATTVWSTAACDPELATFTSDPGADLGGLAGGAIDCGAGLDVANWSDQTMFSTALGDLRSEAPASIAEMIPDSGESYYVISCVTTDLFDAGTGITTPAQAHDWFLAGPAAGAAGKGIGEQLVKEAAKGATAGALSWLAGLIGNNGCPTPIPINGCNGTLRVTLTGNPHVLRKGTGRVVCFGVGAPVSQDFECVKDPKPIGAVPLNMKIVTESCNFPFAMGDGFKRCTIVFESGAKAHTTRCA